MGGSKKSTIGYKYFLGVHMVLCHGPVDKIFDIYVADKQVWTGSNSGGSIYLRAPEIFGGTKREGGIEGLVDVEMGGPEQGQNSYLLGQLGALLPSFRGVVGLVLRQCYLGMNPYLKNWSIRLQRIFVTTGGREQWYKDKAQIVALPEVTFFDDLQFSAQNASIGPYAGITINSGFTANDVIVVSKVPGLTYKAWSYWQNDDDPRAQGKPWTNAFWVTDDKDNTTLYWGGELDEDAGAVTERYATQLEADSAHSNDYVFLSGSTSYTFWINDAPAYDNRGGLSIRVWKGGNADMNPAHVIRECLTSTEWGLGYPESDIDHASFTAAADALHSEAMGFSIIWDRQTSVEDFISEVLRHIDASLYVDRRTSKYVLKLVRGGYNKADLLRLDEDNIIKIENVTRPTLGELVNSVTVKFWDFKSRNDSAVTAQDIALMQLQQNVVTSTIDYPGFTNAQVATKVAQRDLKSLSVQRLSCTIYSNSVAKNLNPGDVFIVNFPDLGISEIVMRVTGISYGTAKTTQVKIDCTEDLFDLPQYAMIPPPEIEWIDPIKPLTDLQYVYATESPYYSLIFQMGQSELDTVLSERPEAGYALVAARRNNSEINATLMADNGSGYRDISVLDFCPHCKLTAPVGKNDVVFPIGDLKDFGQIEIGEYGFIGNEVVTVKFINALASTITVGRGCLDTTPAVHASGASMFFCQFLSNNSSSEYVHGENVSVKVLPSSGSNRLAIGLATPRNILFNSRAIRPYAPGNFKVNGQYFPADAIIGDETELSWSHRSRTQQTAEEVYDFLEGDIGPEVGTTYVVRVLTSADGSTFTQRLEYDVAGTSFIFNIENLNAYSYSHIKFQVWSKRDDILSYQCQEHVVVAFQPPVNLSSVFPG